MLRRVNERMNAWLRRNNIRTICTTRSGAFVDSFSFASVIGVSAWEVDSDSGKRGAMSVAFLPLRSTRMLISEILSDITARYLVWSMRCAYGA